MSLVFTGVTMKVFYRPCVQVVDMIPSPRPSSRHSGRCRYRLRKWSNCQVLAVPRKPPHILCPALMVLIPFMGACHRLLPVQLLVTGTLFASVFPVMSDGAEMHRPRANFEMHHDGIRTSTEWVLPRLVDGAPPPRDSVLVRRAGRKGFRRLANAWTAPRTAAAQCGSDRSDCRPRPSSGGASSSPRSD